MGRKKLYTDAEKKLLKHYRNQIYYNRKVVAQLENIGETDTGIKNGADFLYGSKITLSMVRGKMVDVQSPDAIFDYFFDDDLYYNTDFREYALQDEDYRHAIEPWLSDIGYGTIEDYERYTRAKAKVENAESMLSILRNTSWKAE